MTPATELPFNLEKSLHYNNSIELLFNAKKHTYAYRPVTDLNDLKSVAGVTTPLSIIAKPALIWWAIDQTLKHIDKQWDINGEYDEITKSQILDEAKYAHRRSLKTAADTGTLTHSWIEKYIKSKIAGTEVPDKPKNIEAKQASQVFEDWAVKYKVKFLFSERKVLSMQRQFAGTTDIGCEIEGKKLIGDVKTSSGIYPEMFLQLGAYHLALEEEFPEQKWDDTFIIRCGRDGSLDIENSSGVRNEIFNSAIGTIPEDAKQCEQNKKGFLYALMLFRRIKVMEAIQKEGLKDIVALEKQQILETEKKES